MAVTKTKIALIASQPGDDRRPRREAPRIEAKTFGTDLAGVRDKLVHKVLTTAEGRKPPQDRPNRFRQWLSGAKKLGQGPFVAVR